MATFLADSEPRHRRSRERRACRRRIEPGREERQRSRSPQSKRLAQNIGSQTLPSGRGEKEERKNNSTQTLIHGCIPAVSVGEEKHECQVGVNRDKKFCVNVSCGEVASRFKDKLVSIRGFVTIEIPWNRVGSS